MSTHVPGFQSLLRFFASFSIGKISHMQHKGSAVTASCKNTNWQPDISFAGDENLTEINSCAYNMCQS